MSNKKSVNSISILTWAQARESVRQVNPALCEVIDKLSPEPKHKLVATKYQYGDTLLHKNGGFCLPHNTPLSQSNKTIEQALRYAPVPVGLITSKCVEVFFESNTRLILDRIWGAGNIFGLWELLGDADCSNGENFWSLIAGTRSIFMLPKISDAIAHRRLCDELSLKSLQPKNFLDHHKIFVEIAQNTPQGQQWQCEVLYFSKEWFENQSGAHWNAFRELLFKKAWEQSYICRSHMNYTIFWGKVVEALSHKRMYVQPHILNHIKQIFLIAEGLFPGLRPCNGNNQIAPVDLIEQCYRDIYMLKEYVPLMIAPACSKKYQPVYYSLNLPTYYESVIYLKSTPKIMNDLRNIQSIIDIIQKEIVKSSHYQFSYFHTSKDAKNIIQNAMHIPQHDNQIQHYVDQYGLLKFPNTSFFFNGCVKIDALTLTTPQSQQYE